MVPCSVTDNGNEDSETAILQLPHRLGYSLDLHMLDCCVLWSQTFFAWVFCGRKDKIDEKERRESLTSSRISNLALWCYVIQTNTPWNSETRQILRFVDALLSQNKNICFMLCVRVILLCRQPSDAGITKNTRKGYIKVGNCSGLVNSAQEQLIERSKF